MSVMDEYGSGKNPLFDYTYGLLFKEFYYDGQTIRDGKERIYVLSKFFLQCRATLWQAYIRRD